MKFGNIFKTAGSCIMKGASKVVFGAKKHSPEILLVTGVVGGVTATVLACKETPKALELMKKRKEELNIINEAVNDETLMASDEYSKKQYCLDLVSEGKVIAIDIAKTYGPAIVVGSLSIACIFISHDITKKRLSALASAYATVVSGFTKYRQHVVERYGKDVDDQLRYGIKSKAIEESVSDSKGKTN